MFKFVFSMGLGLALLAGVGEAASSAQPVNAPEAIVADPSEQAYMFPGQRFGPWTLEFARTKMLDWMEHHGINCHLEPGWYVVID